MNFLKKVEVVPDGDSRTLGLGEDEYGNAINPENFIELTEAKEIDADLEVGDTVNYDLEFENMGRNAATILT